jgi:hypothetical protein
MSLNELNDAARSSGGTWVKLSDKGDKIRGRMVPDGFENRPKTFEGEPVLSRKTGKQRYEYVFTLETEDTDGPEDDGIRKVALNESGQRAVQRALREAGVEAEVGGLWEIAVVADKPTATSQAEYAARYTPPTQKVDIPAAPVADGPVDLDDLF